MAKKKKHLRQLLPPWQPLHLHRSQHLLHPQKPLPQHLLLHLPQSKNQKRKSSNPLLTVSKKPLRSGFFDA